ncbi:MAG: Fe-S cluster assembly ATPase SufC [Fimbriimonadaceae bacterium]|nr:Fe-S cluster assembly ATPase SufC [Fimbriimonadaceae bacterium]
MADGAELVIRDLRATVAGKEILKGVNLTLGAGERHVLLGANGSGKSTLAYVLMGHPNYTVTGGSVEFAGQDLLALEPDERARLGLFLAFQYPKEITGVTVSNFLRTAVEATRGEKVSLREFSKLLTGHMATLEMQPEFARRYLNEGFSGGERKRNEMLQLLALQPKLAILDETDSGLDVQMRQLVANVVRELASSNTGFLVVTHYEDVVRQMQPQHVHIMLDGRIAMSGGLELVERLGAEKSFDWVREEVSHGAVN